MQSRKTTPNWHSVVLSLSRSSFPGIPNNSVSKSSISTAFWVKRLIEKTKPFVWIFRLAVRGTLSADIYKSNWCDGFSHIAFHFCERWESLLRRLCFQIILHVNLELDVESQQCISGRDRKNQASLLSFFGCDNRNFYTKWKAIKRDQLNSLFYNQCWEINCQIERRKVRINPAKLEFMCRIRKMHEWIEFEMSKFKKL